VIIRNFIQYFKDYPDLFVMFFGPFRPAIILTNIEHIKKILKTTGMLLCEPGGGSIEEG